MELDLSWVLWAVPLAFAAGWVASRFDIRQWRVETRSAPKSYFKGLNHLLNEQQDQAIDAFIEAVQQDPDTTDLHFALGNLFRRRGDYDRAVRVHQHLLQRADLSAADRERAQHALAMDFMRAGLLDRAEASLQQLTGTTYEAEAQLALLGLYERTREWAKAIPVAQALESAQQGSFTHRMAHYHCELAQDAMDRQAVDDARVQLNQALALAPDSARPHLDLARLLAQTQQPALAFEQLLVLATQAPKALPLAAKQLAQLALTLDRAPEARRLLATAEQQAPSVDHVEALALLLPAEATEEKSALFLQHLQREPSLVVAAGWLGLGGDPSVPEGVLKAVNKAAVPLRRYRCAACGFEAGTHFWQCPGCQTWDSYSPRRVDEL
ncbi:MAG: lipopolysaccharide assembly protein LapB [Burkholderiaceae bacterium]